MMQNFLNNLDTKTHTYCVLKMELLILKKRFLDRKGQPDD